MKKALSWVHISLNGAVFYRDSEIIKPAFFLEAFFVHLLLACFFGAIQRVLGFPMS